MRRADAACTIRLTRSGAPLAVAGPVPAAGGPPGTLRGRAAAALGADTGKRAALMIGRSRSSCRPIEIDSLLVHTFRPQIAARYRSWRARPRYVYVRQIHA